MKNKKIFLLVSVIIICLGLLGLSFYLLVNDGEYYKETRSNTIYGTIVDVGNNYIEVESLDNEKYAVFTNNKYSEGDFVAINYNKNSDLNRGNASIEVIMESDETIIIDDNYEELKSTTTTTTTNQTTINKTTLKNEISSTKTTVNKTTSKPSSTITTKKMTTTKTVKPVVTTTKISTASEAEVVNYIKNEYENVSTNDGSTTREKAKNTFITIVDFIFYDGEIKGKRFNELTSSAKAKVVYYALLLDTKIDNKWPNYKSELQAKYSDIKAKLIAKYMDLTTSICKNNQENCANVKSDFLLLKKSVSLTWEVVKGAFSYAYNKGATALIEWYEIFSGKK